MTLVGQYAYLPKQLDEPSRLVRFARLYLHPVRVIGEKRIVTSDDLPVTPIIGCIRIITDGLSGHDPEKLGGFG